MRLRLISCAVFYREMCAVIACSPHQVDVEFLPKGLHDLPSADMQARLQERIDAVDPDLYDAILLGYGLCNNGTSTLRAPAIPLVLPRAHDCIALFMGSRKRYLDFFHANPGVYFKTSGWIERAGLDGELSQLSVQHRNGMDASYEELVEKYGEDNADFLFETLCQHTRNYGQLTFIEMGVEPDGRFEEDTRAEAQRRGWSFQKIRGEMRLIRDLVNGDWAESDFLVVPPGRRVAPSHDEDIVKHQPS